MFQLRIFSADLSVIRTTKEQCPALRVPESEKRKRGYTWRLAFSRLAAFHAHYRPALHPLRLRVGAGGALAWGRSRAAQASRKDGPRLIWQCTIGPLERSSTAQVDLLGRGAPFKEEVQSLAYETVLQAAEGLAAPRGSGVDDLG
jgi:hypothetical protein